MYAIGSPAPYSKATGLKRNRSRSPSDWRRPYKSSHTDHDSPAPDRVQQQRGINSRGALPHAEQDRLNQLQEDERMREWVAQEDTFVLKQAKKKAEIHVREGRAKPIDWLAVTLRVIDHTRDPLDEDVGESELDIVDPNGVFDGLSRPELSNLEKDIDTYIHLETSSKNKEYWLTMKIVCQDWRRKSEGSGPEGRAVSSVASDIDHLLSPKSSEELEALEKQIRQKLTTNGPIDTDYWEQLLKSLLVWKARAKLKKVYQAVIESRLSTLKTQSEQEAVAARDDILTRISKPLSCTASTFRIPDCWDPEAQFQIRLQDRGLDVLDESAFLQRVSTERRIISKLGFVPYKRPQKSTPALQSIAGPTDTSLAEPGSRFAAVPCEDFSQATKALYEREVARGIAEDEEIFAGEEEVDTKSKALWSGKYRPRKPRYFNRVQMGYEWNKYNQTHYDHDNPPPKVVQGYKFNVFYPDLIDKTKAPTYKMEREGGRKKGQSFAPAGEDDTCVIRFMAGPPYEDVAFRIVVC